MPASQGMINWVRVGLVTALAVGPAAFRFDGDGDRAVERVELVRHGDDRWIDDSIADGGGWRLVSTTRVPGAAGKKWSLAVDVVAPGQVVLRVRDGGGQLTSWRRQGLGFERVADNGS